MQDSGQKGDAMHKGIMLSGQSADNVADSVPASDNMQYVYYTPKTLEVLHANLHMSESTWRKVIAADPVGWSAMFADISAPLPDPSCPHTAPSSAPQANSTPLAATLESK